MSGEIIPFGKYKGKPIEALTQDREYVDWLTAQPWFRERFANFYTLIVNQTGEPSETPEHNKLQTLFLGAAFRCGFLQFAFPSWSAESSVSFEVSGFDVRVESYCYPTAEWMKAHPLIISFTAQAQYAVFSRQGRVDP